MKPKVHSIGQAGCADYTDCLNHKVAKDAKITEKTISIPEMWAFDRLFHNGQLLTQGQVLDDKVRIQST